MDNKKNESFGSRFGFIMTAAGFSIGLGNIWRFPYLVGTNGGGAFVAIYLLIAFAIGIPLFAMEMSLGRKGQASPVIGMRKINGKGNIWNSFAWLGVLAAYFILTYYVQIMGWIVNYFIKNVTAAFQGQNIDQISQAFVGLRENWLILLVLTLVCIVIIGLISAQGLEKGVEAACKFMMPALFIMLIIMAIRSMTLEGAMEGFKWYLTPDFSKVTGQTFLNALGQVFFSIGIASGGALVYGSYLGQDSDIPTDGTIIVLFDTFAALLAGTIIFPAVFAMGLEPGQGPGLLFVTMSKVFSEMPGGQIFGAIFFILLFFAALSSALGYLEPVATTVRDVFKMERKKAVWVTLGLIMLGAILPILSSGPLKDVTILGMSIFDFDDYLSGNILMPLGAIVISFYVIFKWKFEGFRDAVNIGAEKIKVGAYWKPLVFLVVPIALLIIFASGIITLFK